MTIISILRQAAQSTLDYKRQIKKLKSEQIDITNFQDNLEDFKNSFLTSTNGAVDNFNKAINEINQVIESLENIRDSLLGNSGKKLNAALKKVEKLTVKKLTKNNPTMAAKFAALKEEP